MLERTKNYKKKHKTNAFKTSIIISLFLFCFIMSCAKNGANNKDNIYAFSAQDTNMINSESGKMLRGTLYLPLKDEKMPLVITAHELGSNSRRRWPSYAEALASRGIAVYTFDFAGGGPKVRSDGQPGSRSDGETKDMSVLTEIHDLETVFEHAKTWSFVDKNKIVIIGGSQGGAVAIAFAGMHTTEIKGLVVMYPALYELDRMIKSYGSAKNFPESLVMWGMVELGRKYAEDMWDFDFEPYIKAYNKPVFLLHGDKDNIVPFSDSEKLRKTYPNAQLKLVSNGMHGFQGETFNTAIEYIIEYLKEIEII